jgi:hypothetical protein
MVGSMDGLLRIAAGSDIAGFYWKNRGVAPAGYIQGMALAYARVYGRLKGGDASALAMAAAAADPDRDGLAWYDGVFAASGMRNDTAGADTLRHLFVLLIGLGMRESSGRYCEGRDRAAANTTADTAEAGLFQTSFNASSASPLLPAVFARYRADPSGLLEVFRRGVRCSAADRENFGDGDGLAFQKLSKQCPAFAVEFAAIGLRCVRTHWGPINRREVQVRPECDAMLRAIQAEVDQPISR